MIGISVDPANDNPKRAKSFLLKQQMTGRMEFLLGTRARARSRSGTRSRSSRRASKLEHSAHTVLADADGFQRIGFPFDHLTEAGLAHDLERLSS